MGEEFSYTSRILHSNPTLPICQTLYRVVLVNISPLVPSKYKICVTYCPYFIKEIQPGSQNCIRALQTASLELSALPACVALSAGQRSSQCRRASVTPAGKAEISSEAVCYALMLFFDPDDFLEKLQKIELFKQMLVLLSKAEVISIHRSRLLSIAQNHSNISITSLVR